MGVKEVEAPVVVTENVPTKPAAATDENVDHDYEDVTPLKTVVEEVVEKPRDSFVETKEEIVDNLEFIKAKLSTSPIAPVKAKRASKEAKEACDGSKAKGNGRDGREAKGVGDVGGDEEEDGRSDGDEAGRIFPRVHSSSETGQEPSQDPGETERAGVDSAQTELARV